MGDRSRDAAGVPAPADPLAGLPDLMSHTRYDAALRQVPTEAAAIEEAVVRAERRLSEAGARRDTRGTARLLGYLGEADRVLGRYDAAVARQAEALGLARSLGDRRLEVASQLRLGEAHRYRDNLAIAERLFREALAACAQSDRTAYADFALQHLGKCRLDQGDVPEALACFDRALRLRRAKGEPALVASTEQAIALAQGSGVVSGDEDPPTIGRPAVPTDAGRGFSDRRASLLDVGFIDPDGTSHEVVWVKPGVPVERGIRRAEWTTVDLE